MTKSEAIKVQRQVGGEIIREKKGNGKPGYSYGVARGNGCPIIWRKEG